MRDRGTTPTAAGGVRLSPASCCYRLLSWECEVPEPELGALLAQELPAHGFVDETRFAAVREFKAAAGHRVVLIPKTGRLQIRVHYLTPLEAREAAALHVAKVLEQVLRRVISRDQGFETRTDLMAKL